MSLVFLGVVDKIWIISSDKFTELHLQWMIVIYSRALGAWEIKVSMWFLNKWDRNCQKTQYFEGEMTFLFFSAKQVCMCEFGVQWAGLKNVILWIPVLNTLWAEPPLQGSVRGPAWVYNQPGRLRHKAPTSPTSRWHSIWVTNAGLYRVGKKFIRVLL